MFDGLADNIVGLAFPPAEALPDVGGFRRRWVLRLRDHLPIEGTIKEIVKGFEAEARRTISDHLGSLSEADPIFPRASATRLADHHLVVGIDCPDPAKQRGDEAAIGTFEILRLIDGRWGLEDLQGIPKRHWFFLARE